MRTSSFTEQGTPRPDGRSSAGYGPPQPGVVPLQLPSASLQYGPSGLSLFSPGMPAAGVAAGDADEPAQLDARGLFYNHADRTLPNGDDVFTAGHPMAAWSASPLSNDTHGLLGAAAAALRDAPARAVNGSGAVHVPFPSHAGGHVHASTVGLGGGPRGEVALVAASGSLIPPGGALARPVGDSYRSYTHHWSSESSSMPVPRPQARAPPMQLNIRPMRNGGAPESSATDTAAPSSSAPGLPLAPAPAAPVRAAPAPASLGTTSEQARPAGGASAATPPSGRRARAGARSGLRLPSAEVRLGLPADGHPVINHQSPSPWTPWSAQWL